VRLAPRHLPHGAPPPSLRPAGRESRLQEPEVGELLAEIDAAAYVIDCCPNLDGPTTAARTRPLVELLRKARPDTPIVLVEDRRYADSWLRPGKKARNDANHAALKAAYDELVAAGVPGLHYLGGDDLLGADGEGTVDSSHPTDSGFVDPAKTFAKVLDPLLR
jgi:GDSL-like Lipase/Acylhydrolase family